MHRSPTFSLDDDKIEALKSSTATASFATTTPASKALDDFLKSRNDDPLVVVGSSNKRPKKKQDDTPQTSLVSLVQRSTEFDMSELFHAATAEEPGKKAFDFPSINWSLLVEEEVKEDNSNSDTGNEGRLQVKSGLKGLVGERHQEEEEEGNAFRLRDSTTGSRRVKSTSCLLGKRKLSGFVRSKTLRHGVDRLLDCTSN